jgi:hypothetical protein
MPIKTVMIDTICTTFPSPLRLRRHPRPSAQSAANALLQA